MENSVIRSLYQLDNRNLFQLQAAQEFFTKVDAKDGTFLVRDSSKHPHWHVLAVLYKETMFNFEIKNYVSSE
jgi:hypothetical protein